MSDQLIKLHFPQRGCRVEVLRMDAAWQAMVQNQALPTNVCSMLGELTAAAVMLAAGLKFDGALVVQIQGDGPVKLALVEVRTGLLARATVQLRVPVEAVDPAAQFKDLVNANGNGRCAIILDMASRAAGEQPYQGVVPLTGNTVAETLQSYMTQSEQIPTHLWLAADSTACAGVLLQRVAAGGGKQSDVEIDPEGFSHLSALAQTVRRDELLGLASDEVARRLFWEDNPQVLETLTPRFVCRCSKAGIEAMVKNLGEQEAQSILAERGNIEVRCEFCGTLYTLDAIDVASLFSGNSTPPATVH